MSLKLSSLLKVSVAGFVLISVGACKPADKGQGALKSDALAALELNRADASVFGKYFATKACAADEMESLGALAGLGMGEDGTNGVTFSARKTENGIVTYRDLTVSKDGTEKFSAKQALFYCPQMGDDAPSFDRLDLTDAKVSDDGVVFSFDALSLAQPTPMTAAAIIDGITGGNKANGNDIGLRAMSLSGASVESDEFSGTLSTLVWGETRGEDQNGKADLMIEDLNVTAAGDNGGQPLTLTFEGMSARNLNVGQEISPENMATPDQMVSQILGNMSTFEKPYDEMRVGKLNLDSAGFAIDFEGIEGKTSKKGDVLTTRQTLKPLKIMTKPAMEKTAEFAQAYTILKSLGFETITLSGSSVTTLDKSKDTVSVSDGLLVMDDAFDLNFEYSAEGLDAMTQKLKSLTDAGADPKAAYDALKLQSMRLTLEDKSIVERGLKLASEMTGQDPKTIKRGLGMAVFAAAMAAENDVQAEVYSETVEAFADFVKDGGTLTIEANPPAPFPLAPLISGKGADVDPATLGFSASQETEAP